MKSVENLSLSPSNNRINKHTDNFYWIIAVAVSKGNFKVQSLTTGPIKKLLEFTFRRGTMINVQYMKPFYTKVTDNTLRLVFAYQYFSITKDDELYHFIPVDGKEMIINLNTMQIENLSEIFVFQRGNRFVRYPLYQLLVQSDVHDHLMSIIDEAITQKETVNLVTCKEESEIEDIISLLEVTNLERLIDEALEERNEALFYDLVEKREKYKQKSV